MKGFLKIVMFLLVPAWAIAQQSFPDSLKRIFQSSKNDSVLYDAAIHLYDFYEEVNRDSAFLYADHCVQISRRNNKKINEAHVLTRKAYQQVNRGQYAESFQSLLASFALSEDKKNEKSYWNIGTLRPEKEKRLYALTCAHHIYGILMRETLNLDQAVIHFREAKKIAVDINSYARSLLGSLNLGRVYLNKGFLDSAQYHLDEATSIVKSSGWGKYLSTIFYYLGIIDLGRNDSTRALRNFHQSVESAIKENNTDALTRSYHRLADYYIHRQQYDSGIYYAHKSLDAMKVMGAITQIEYHSGGAYEGLYRAYQSNGQLDSAYRYLALAQTTNDSISQRRIKSLAEFQSLTLNEQQRLQTIEKERVAYQNKTKTYFMLAGIGVLLLLAIIFYRNNRQKHRAKLKIEQAYDNLKATQQQLVQSEKMASLGELTAGIAHEIQNPLNFVNNFSELNNELIEELKSQRATLDSQEQDELLKDIFQNNEKINHHGKRADAIVKGMLQHSRNNNGKKEVTDINALADEYLRLAYHGFRAKDKSFNATLKTEYDQNANTVNIVPQDMGRVILNLITNAFYAVNEKAKQDYDIYEPIVTVRINRMNGNSEGVEISVADNGDGIPSKVLDKIFQPFFTTKPTGQGTGLGLSISYDIVKAHGGELKVQTSEGVGTEFTIVLPKN